jgi:hypothetical protein
MMSKVRGFYGSTERQKSDTTYPLLCLSIYIGRSTPCGSGSWKTSCEHSCLWPTGTRIAGQWSKRTRAAWSSSTTPPSRPTPRSWTLSTRASCHNEDYGTRAASSLPTSETTPRTVEGNFVSTKWTQFKGRRTVVRVIRGTSPKSTVKAPNFGPHGNFGPPFQKGLLSLKRVLQKTEENKSCRKTLDLQICFCSYLVHDSSKEATELAKKGPKFPWGPKLGAFTVL